MGFETTDVNPTDQDFNQNSRTSSRKRRLRRCRSAPRDGDCVYNNDTKIDEPPSSPSNIPVFNDLNPSLKRVIMFLGLYLTIGTLCFYLVRNQISGHKTNGVLDAVYFCIVTMTTVGYGDLVPNSYTSRLLACAFVFSGMVLVGHLLSRAADYLVEKQESLLVRAFHLRQIFGPTDILKELRTNKLRRKCYVTFFVLVFLFLVGTFFLVTVEKMPVLQAFYCVCSTVTTLGYGDKSFSSGTGRLFAVFWILTSTICLAQFFLYVVELRADTKQRALVKWVLTRRITNNDLEAADLDEDGIVGAAEFVVYKLKEMGKIDEKDVDGIMEEFEQLDDDESGTLTTSDIVLAQTTSQISSSGSPLFTRSDLVAADIDGDGVVGVAEFIVYRLKQMDKIDQKDIIGITKEFQQLDYDESRTLTNSDIDLAQIQSSASPLFTKNDLEAADLDGDGVVGAAEFLVYRLKQMEKIDQEDMIRIMEEFEKLDHDESGALTSSDIDLAQKTTLSSSSSFKD
ncbi:unnamed protein product [Thlaspi arvense]|uniref:Uncharacterized protein n=1 Tax=Thlaspi arvense TaxID=13288 RepID=A0AAU9RW90_THLAR|nr:unnamed protein product [Thlaspi arvense]